MGPLFGGSFVAEGNEEAGGERGRLDENGFAEQRLRNWFAHNPEKWRDFQLRYFAELDKKPESWQPLLQLARKGDLTLVFSAHDTQHNNAVALRMYLTKRLKKPD